MIRRRESSSSHGPHLLPSLLASVVRARTREHHELRQSGARPEVVNAARLDTLLALSDYAAAIEALSWPVPRSILMDIKLHQSLVAPASKY